MKTSKSIYYISKVVNIFELAIAFLLLLVIAVNLAQMALNLVAYESTILGLDFRTTLSLSFTLVIGLEFIKMLCKHTPESVIDVLLFTIARQMVMYHESTQDLFVGVAAITVLFLAKRYLMNASDK
jgi:hypothetical protein